jgi:hypothetical protein
MKLNTALYIAASAITLAFIVGCQPGVVQNKEKIDYTPIAGTWKAEKGAWQIVISNNGKVISAVHPAGTVWVKPNETIYTEMKDGSKSQYTGGDFTLFYDPNSREMEVTITMKKIHIKFLDNEIEGHTETTIVGFLSADFTLWDADIIEIFDYGPRFPQAGISPNPMKFYKIK